MKKGFTLVEVLAVVTILGVLGLVTVPIVSNSLEKSKKKAFKSTVYGIIDATRIYRADNNYNDYTNELIDVTGNTIQYENKDQILSGYIQYIDGEYVITNIKNDEYCASGNSTSIEIFKGDCE